MGTNYYCWTDTEQELHIGKSSAGWVFSLRIHEAKGILNLYDWIPILVNSGTVIRDEYGRHITAQEMLKNITVRGRDYPVQWNDFDWNMNQAEPGPNNLVRHKQMSDYGRTCTHGEGTWDYCDYEFS
jgi:hypothetical protein